MVTRLEMSTRKSLAKGIVTGLQIRATRALSPHTNCMGSIMNPRLLRRLVIVQRYDPKVLKKRTKVKT
jgi:hypothetical protein